MYSSKVIEIDLPLKHVELFRGEVSTTTGGTLSLGPPLGVTTLAQRHNDKADIKMTKYFKTDFMSQK